MPPISGPTSFRSPSIVMHNPYGRGESRENLFEENFNLAPPSLIPSCSPPAPSAHRPLPIPGRQPGGPKSALSSPAPPPRSPLKPVTTTAAAAGRIRHKKSGIAAVKSRGNLKEEIEVQRRKAEIKAKTERRQEERELREMLGGA